MSDFISKRELYHKLGEAYNAGLLTWGANEIVKDIIGECLSFGNKGKWIPVSERLPEDGRPVLIYAQNVHHVVARYDSFRTENGYKKCWVTADAWNGNTEIRHDVIAWMPLPEPYKSI